MATSSFTWLTEARVPAIRSWMLAMVRWHLRFRRYYSNCVSRPLLVGPTYTTTSTTTNA